MKRKRASATLLLFMMLLLCGCEPISVTRSKPEYSVGVVLKSMNNPYWMSLKSGMERAAEEENVDFTLLYPRGEQEFEEQKGMIQDELESGIDILIVSPCDSFQAKWIEQEAERKHVKLLTVDTRAIGTDIPFVGQDYAQFGEITAEYFNTNLKQGESVLLVLGSDNQSGSVDLEKEIRKNLSKDIRLKQAVHGELTEEDAYQAVIDLQEPVEGVFCQSIIAGRGASAALKEKGWTARIMAIDTGENEQQVVAMDSIEAFITQDGYEIGYQAVREAMKMLRTNEKSVDILFQGELRIKNAMEEPGE